jgi:hypothetical protein
MMKYEINGNIYKYICIEKETIDGKKTATISKVKRKFSPFDDLD